MPEDKKITHQDDLDREEKKVTDEITRIFSSSGFEYQSDVVVGSSSSDVYSVFPTGSTAMFKVHLWKPTKENIERASQLANSYISASGVDNAYVVLPNLPISDPEKGVVSVADFDEVVRERISKQPKKSGHEPPSVSTIPDVKVFAAMPFDPKYDDTFIVAMEPACFDVGAECIRVDRESYAGDILSEIKNQIANSHAVIADLSESNPNVFFEIGFADGLDIPVVQICSTPVGELPFDVRNNLTLNYVLGQTSRLRTDLAEILKSILS